MNTQIWDSVPTTDEEAIERFSAYTDDPIANESLVGIYKAHRGKGDDPLRAVELTLRSALRHLHSIDA